MREVLTGRTLAAKNLTFGFLEYFLESRGEWKLNTVRATKEFDGSFPYIARQVLLYAPGSLIPMFIGLLTSAIFTRVLSSTEYGRYSLVLGVTTLIVSLSSQWLQQGINRYLPGVSEAKALQEIKGAIVVSVVIITALMTGLLIPATLVAWSISTPNWRSIVLPSALLVLVSSVFTVLTTVFQAEMRAGRYSVYNLVNGLLRFFLSLILTFYVYMNPASLIWANALALATVFPVMWRDSYMPRVTLVVVNWKQYLPMVRKIATYGYPMIGWFVAASLLSVGDRYVIQIFRGSAEVGIYSANYTLISGVVGLISAPILLGAHPFLMRVWSEGDLDATGIWLGRIIEWFGIMAILLIGATGLFAQDLSKLLLGPAFLEGYRVMPVVLAGVIFSQLGLYTHKPLEFAGQTKMMFRLSIGTAFINVVLNFALVPWFGYIAAAYATLISYVIYAVVTATVGQRYLRWHLRWKYLAVNSLVSGAVLLVTVLVRVAGEYMFGYLPGLILAALWLVCAAILVLWGTMRSLLNSPNHRRPVE